jgi:hypothetical protein
MNDAHAYEMQMQIWEPNTWGVTYSSPKAFDFAFLSSYHLIRLFVELGKDKRGLLASCHVAKSKTGP